MPQAIIFANPDGSIVTTIFTHDDEALIQRDIAELQKDGVSAVKPGAAITRYASHDAVAAVLPPREHRRFRACWRWQGGQVGVDLPLAREQRLAEVRRERDAKLAATDGPLLRDQEQGKDVSGLLQQRQALRDLPLLAQIEMASLDADGLITYTPEMLK